MTSILIFLFLLVITYFIYKFLNSMFHITALHISNILLITLIGAFVGLIIIFPKISFAAASNGLNLWLNVVVPSLLPFFIGSEILIGLGFVNFLGTLLEPIMRTIFNVPGAGSFAFALGMTSGYPAGAKISTMLREKNLCTKTEGERLLTFTNNSGPLFIIGAVAVGMFDNPKLGILLAIAHYSAAITIGFLFRFYKMKEKSQEKNSYYFSAILLKSFREMFKARRKDGRSIGGLLGDAIKNSMNLLLIIGGFIIFFSVIISILTNLGVIYWLTNVISVVLQPFSIDKGLISAVLSGIFELTTGCKLAAASSAAFIQKVVATALILGWAGLSVHLQVISIISSTDLSSVPYLFAKFFQSIIAAFYTYLMFRFMTVSENIPVFRTMDAPNSWINYFTGSSEMFIGIFIFIVICAILINIMKRILVINLQNSHYFKK